MQVTCFSLSTRALRCWGSKLLGSKLRDTKRAFGYLPPSLSYSPLIRLDPTAPTSQLLVHPVDDLLNRDRNHPSWVEDVSASELGQFRFPIWTFLY